MTHLTLVRRSSSRFFRMAFAIVASLTFAFSVAAAPTTKKSFDLPAGDAATTLKLYAQQSGEQIVYPLDQIRGVKTNAVKGEVAPLAALEQMLADTGLVVVQDEKTGAIAVRRQEPAEPKNGPSRLADAQAAEIGAGSVQGEIMLGVEGVAGARVSVVGTSAFVLTDRFGSFRLDALPAGAHELLIEGEHIARARVTGVVVNPDRAVTLATIRVRARSSAIVGRDEDVLSAEKLKDVYQLEKMQVSATKLSPYVGANIDLPRTENDAQPYYIYDSAQIERSGALGVVDFFQKFVPMNYRKAVLEQTPNAINGATSIFSLFGPIGQNQTLVLVNGRMQANVMIGGSSQQADVNGIPVGAIDRIEILPASASAIYGGSAMGGVINIVLKQNYVGGEVRLNYEQAAGDESPTTSATMTGGLTLENGKTHVFVSANYTERPQLLLGDRDFLLDYIERWQDALYGQQSATYPLLGATGNITTGSATTNLILKSAYGGTDLGSPISHLPVGYNGASTSGVAALVANAGRYNTAPANNAAGGSGYGFGLRSPLAQGIRLRGLSFSARRAMLLNLEAYANFDFRSNRSTSDLGLSDGLALTLPATAPTNPFMSTVYVNVPSNNAKRGLFSTSETRDFVTGLKLSLPRDWTAVGEFHHVRTNFDYQQWTYIGTRLNADIASGAFDILRDLPTLGIDLAQYRGLLASRNASTLTEFTGRASGTALELPGGNVRSTFIVGRRKQGNKEGETLTEYENYPLDFSRSITLPRHIVNESYAAELSVPVFGQKFVFPLLQSLEFQIAGRYDDYHAVQRAYVGNFTSTITTRAINRSESRYSSDNQTYGLTWKPVRDVMIRASYSTAFTPPDPSDLLPTTLTTTTKTTITDPLRGNSRYIVESLGSGNPDLKPEDSESATVGVVVTPRWVPGLRLAVDYSAITRNSSRGSLSVQQLINYETDFPERITRAAPVAGDAYSAGAITFVDTRYLNLFKTESAAYNLRADYSFRTAIGNWSLGGVASTLQHYRVQTVFLAPLTEMIGNEAQPSYLIPKWKGNATLTWEKGPLRAGWTTRYYSRYLQSATSQAAQGGRFVPEQTYHDVQASYQFPSRGSNNSRLSQWLANTSVQVGVKNVFNTKPPYDVATSIGYSAYGDLRLASYWLSLKKEF